MKENWSKLLYKVPDLPGEEWRQIEDSVYYVSNMERVKRSRYERADKNGLINYYPEKLVSTYILIHPTGRKNVYVNLVINGKQKTLLFSRIVAKAFVKNPDPANKIQVNHIDENPTNNRPDNLEWMTAKENINYGTCRERSSESRKKLFAQMTPAERKKKFGDAPKANKKVICDGKIYESAKACAEAFGINHFTFGHYMTGYSKMPEQFKRMGLAYMDE